MRGSSRFSFPSATWDRLLVVYATRGDSTMPPHYIQGEGMTRDGWYDVDASDGDLGRECDKTVGYISVGHFEPSWEGVPIDMSGLAR